MSSAIEIILQDNGPGASVNVPQANVQLVIGIAIGGVVDQAFASSSPVAIQSNYIGGPLVEAAGMIAQDGNVAVCMSVPIVTHGTATAVVATVPGGSTSTVTTTLDSTNGAWDTYNVMVRCTQGGTIGTPGAFVQVSLDAGRNFGTPIALGSATALYLGYGSLASPAIGGTGVQVNFGVGAIVAGDYWRFSTTAPQWNAAGITAALAAFQASQYGVAGVGSIHVVGDCMHGGSTAGDIATIYGQLNAGTAIYQYDRAILELRDALTPTAWGGTGETKTTWINALSTAVSGATAPRILVDGPYYNMPSPFANPAGGQPSYRRPLAWAHARKRASIAPQRRAGRVLDGPYPSIVVNPASDATDGFVYFNALTDSGLTQSRIGCATTWPGKGQGFFQGDPNAGGTPGVGGELLLSTPGSQFTELVIGNVLDIACDIGYQEGVDEVSDDLLLQANGTLDPVAVNQIQGEIQSGLNRMPQTALVSAVTATVSKTADVEATGIIPITISVLPRGYVNAVQETITIAAGG